MNNENAIVNFNPGNATLLEMRADSKRFPRLYTIPRERAVYEMSKIVMQAFLYRGQAADSTTINFIASSLVDEIIANNPYGAASISFAELQVIVKRAVLKEEMFGISVSSLYKVVADFAKGEGTLNQQQVDAKNKKNNDNQPPILQAYTGEFLRNNKLNK